MRILLFLYVALCLTACSSKQYYTPSNIEAEVQPLALTSPLAIQKSGGITLENGAVLTRAGISSYKLERGCVFLNENEDNILMLCDETLRILDKQSGIKQNLSYPHKPIAASMNGEILALVLADNTLLLQNVHTEQILFSQKQPSVSAISDINANPYFLRDLVIFPTLDGALVIVDYNRLQIVRNIVVGNASQFNNVSFLDVFNNRLFAATKFRLIAVSPEYISTQDVNVREVLVLRDRVYIFTTDGEVLLCDMNLNIQKRIKFSFAHFLAVAVGQELAILEKRGYIIALEPDFESFRVYQITRDIQMPTFGDSKALYFGEYYIKIP
ncbi:MAG: hypothetical protein K2O85_07525 [Helicobacter sp.]|nr:hypothetical protein [Helicobacter sp.]